VSAPQQPQPAIRPVVEADLEDLLPLMRAYCAFYETSPADTDLLAMSRALLADPAGRGMQLIARSSAGQAIGFATLFWTFDTLVAAEIGVMNDLYVAPQARSAGLGRSLIDACAERCRVRGVSRMDWQTAPDNARAQRLYDSLGALREEAVVYYLELGR